MGFPKYTQLRQASILRSVLYLLFCAASIFGKETTADWGKPVEGLKCRARPIKPAFKKGEDIVLEFSVSNVSKTNVFFFKGNAIDHWFVELTIDGKYIRRGDYLIDWDLGEGKVHFVLIEPGKVWTTRINVTKNWRPENPIKSGKIVVRYYNPKKNGHSIGIAGWTGTLDSNPSDLLIQE
jgi:hypothetical protein